MSFVTFLLAVALLLVSSGLLLRVFSVLRLTIANFGVASSCDTLSSYHGCLQIKVLYVTMQVN